MARGNDAGMEISTWVSLQETHGRLHSDTMIGRSGRIRCATLRNASIDSGGMPASAVPECPWSGLRLRFGLSLYYFRSLACCPCLAISETALLSKETKVSPPSQSPS
jgi:hypothetical protein